jgi:hypothetical protein
MSKQAAALAKLRTDLEVAITGARHSGVPSRQIGDLLEKQIALARQYTMLTTPSSYA